jgi:putative ATPase
MPKFSSLNHLSVLILSKMSSDHFKSATNNASISKISTNEILKNAYTPLAARLRPQTLSEYIGQQHLLAPGKPLRDLIDRGQIYSMIFWGPPGVGKTSLAKLLAHAIDAHFETLSAVMAGVKDIRNAVVTAESHQQQNGKRTILFVDEVHRFNKSQQDAFLPYVENGVFTFIGATTENPSFELNNALLSRCRVYRLRQLECADLVALLRRALVDDEKGLGKAKLRCDEEVITLLALAANGDARRAINLLEIAADLAVDGELSRDIATEIIGGNVRSFIGTA